MKSSRTNEQEKKEDFTLLLSLINSATTIMTAAVQSEMEDTHECLIWADKFLKQLFMERCIDSSLGKKDGN